MDFIQQNLLLVAVALVSGGMLLAGLRRPPDGRFALSPNQATLLINRQEGVLLDVREVSEYVTGHIPESRNIPLGDLNDRLGDLESSREKPIVVVCRNGSRAQGVCRDLAGRGLGQVHCLSGGIEAWQAAGLPLKKGAKK